MPFVPDAPAAAAPATPLRGFVPDAPAPAARSFTPDAAPPSFSDKAVGAVQAGLRVASDTVDSLGGYFGTLAGGVGGLAGALKVAMTGGVQPDDPRVLAVTGDNRPTTLDNDMVRRPVTALDEAAQQGAQTAVGGLQTARHVAGVAAAGAGNPLAALAAPTTDLANEYAGTVEKEVLQPVAQAFPLGPTPEMAAAGALAPGAATAARASRAGQAVTKGAEVAGKAGAAAVEGVKDIAAKGIAKAVGTPDPELVKVAQLADQFPHPMQIMPDRLVPEGFGKTVAEDVSKAPLAGGAKIEHENAQAFTKNTIDQLDEGSTADRLTAKTLDEALDKQGARIGQAYDQAGALPEDTLREAMSSTLTNATRNGAGDVPRLIENRFHELLDKAEDGTVTPQALRQWDSDIGRQIRSMTDDEAASHLSDLQNAVRDAVRDQLAPEQAAALKDARRRYAYGMMLSPAVATAGKGAGAIVGLDGLVQPGKLINAVTSTRAGKAFMARDQGGPIGDLARVGQLLDKTAKPDVGAAALAHAAGKVAATGTSTVVGKAYNAAAPRVTRMMAPKKEAPPTAAAPAPAKPLLLGYEPPSLQRAAVPVTPEGQALPGDLPQAREDLGTSQRTAGNGAPPLNTTYADYDLTAPEFQPRPSAAPAQTASELSAVDQKDFPRAPSRLEREVPEPSFPHDIIEPDTAKTMVSGRPGETAATDAAGAAMHEPGAVAARAAQQAADEGAAAQRAAGEAAKPKPNAAEQAKLDEIDKTIAATQSDIVRETLQKERDRVMKDVTARDTVEKAKAAAAELRTEAEKMTDPTTKKAMLARADKLDPPRAAPSPKPAGEPLPAIEYADTVEWRKAHGIGNDAEAQRAVLTRQAHDIDPAAINAAAVQHNHNPRAFDRVVDQVLAKGKSHANEVGVAAEGSQGAGAKSDVTGRPAGAAGQQPGAHGDAAAGADGAAPAAGGQAAEDPVAEAARKAQFDVDHPRASDGTFTEKN